jgi:hypothetical protein
MTAFSILNLCMLQRSQYSKDVLCNVEVGLISPAYCTVIFNTYKLSAEFNKNIETVLSLSNSWGVARGGVS